MAQKVLITINPKTAAVEFEIEGVQGSKCTDITSVLTQGNTIEEEQLTASYYENQELPQWTTE